jgi:hypothetical protein
VVGGEGGGWGGRRGGSGGQMMGHRQDSRRDGSAAGEKEVVPRPAGGVGWGYWWRVMTWIAERLENGAKNKVLYDFRRIDSR